MTQMISSLRSNLHFGRYFRLFLMVGVFALAAAGCSLLGQDGNTALHSMFTFEEGEEEWTGSFTDYSEEMDDGGMALTFEHRALPSDLDREGKALFLAGENHSDDLFMFLKRKVTGLEPNTTFNVTYNLEIASNAPSNCVGIGGPPGEAVYLKVGAASVEPKSAKNDQGDYRLNVDKGNQSQGGENAVVAGTIENGVEECHQTPYRMIERGNADNPVTATSDGNGNLWLFVGTDSGFEGMTGLYYDSIEVTIRAN